MFVVRLSWSLEIVRVIEIVKSDANKIFGIPFKVFVHFFEMHIVWKIIPEYADPVACSRWSKIFLDTCFHFSLSWSYVSEISAKECLLSKFTLKYQVYYQVLWVEVWRLQYQCKDIVLTKRCSAFPNWF